jgi:hypothetical protein
LKIAGLSKLKIFWTFSWILIILVHCLWWILLIDVEYPYLKRLLILFILWWYFSCPWFQINMSS